jgi:glycosyltransferase involved in cell wall biosynthesis
MINVLFLTNIPSPYRVDFFNELGKLCKLTVLYELKKAKNRDKKWSNNEKIEFNEVFLRGIRIGNDSALCFSVLKWLKNSTFDIIIIGGYSTPTGMLSVEYLRMKHIPFIISSDGGIAKKESGFRRKVKKHFISSASNWLSPGKTTTNYLIEYGARKEKIFEYPFASLWQNEIRKLRIGSSEKSSLKIKLEMREQKTILSIGRFIPQKGFDLLIKASKLIDENIGVYIVGGAPTKEYCDIVHNLGLKNVHFRNFMHKDLLKEYYLAADLFVLPTRDDIWGLVINEAMSYGLPVITTDRCVAGLELVENNDNGFIVHVNDVQEIAMKIEEILQNEETCTSMSNRSINKIQRYSIENMAHEHLKAIEKILNG